MVDMVDMVALGALSRPFRMPGYEAYNTRSAPSTSSTIINPPHAG